VFYGFFHLYLQSNNGIELGWFQCLPNLSPPAVGETLVFGAAAWSN
jgi:hypothetical protein